MKIGVDIDNVLSNFNEVLLTDYINHDKELRNNGIINKANKAKDETERAEVKEKLEMKVLNAKINNTALEVYNMSSNPRCCSISVFQSLFSFLFHPKKRKKSRTKSHAF